MREGEHISSGLPSLEKLKDACRKAKEWWSRAENLQKPENYPYLDTLEALVMKGRPLPVRLDPLAQLETQVHTLRVHNCLTENTEFRNLEIQHEAIFADNFVIFLDSFNIFADNFFLFKVSVNVASFWKSRFQHSGVSGRLLWRTVHNCNILRGNLMKVVINKNKCTAPRRT